MRDNGGFFVEEKTVTLAERMKEGGFATGAFIGAWVLDSRWGLNQGFDLYSDRFDLSKYKVVNLGTVQKKGDEVMDLALAWLEGVKAKKFFAWVHLYDPHTPYEPPEPFLSRYPGQKYLGEVAYTDEVVGRLVSWLKGAGVWDRTILVLLADHGESLGDHGENSHTFFVYDATQHVPLIVRTPWGDRGRSRAQVSTVDVMPTVLDIAGLAPQPGIDGRSLARLVLDPGADSPGVAYSETYFPRFHFGWQHLRSMRDGRWKYIEAPTPELYDVQQDPGETKNVYKAYSRRAEDLRLLLEKIAGNGVQAAPDETTLDPETLQRLAALGYVGGGPRVDPEAVLPDPKDKIGLFERMGDARALAKDEKLEEAVAAMRAVIAEDAGIIDAHTTLGGWLRKLKRPEEAIAAYRRTLEIDPRNEMALAALAEVYRAQGKPDAAIEGYRTVLKLEPRQPQMWYQLATLYLDLGREADARKTFEEALKHNPKMGAAYNSLAALAFERGDMAEAERLVRKGLELEEDLRSSRFNLGRILEARGDVADAERLYREELAQFADNGRARFNLAQLARQRGDETGFLAELRTSTEKAPEFGPPSSSWPARSCARGASRRPSSHAGPRGGQGLAGGAARPLRPRRRLHPAGQARGRKTRWRKPGGSSPRGATPRRRGTEWCVGDSATPAAPGSAARRPARRGGSPAPARAPSPRAARRDRHFRARGGLPRGARRHANPSPDGGALTRQGARYDPGGGS